MKKNTKKQKLKSIIEEYSYWVEWSEEDKVHIGKCFEFPSLSAHAEREVDAFTQIQYVVSEAVKWMLEENETLPEPLGKKNFKGRFVLRMPSELHRELAFLAIKEGVSINQLIISKL
jgi:predicted HicB family RNase H-like nuclease